MVKLTIDTRRIQVVNTDPQRRCYNGCNYSEEHVWTPWEVLEYTTQDKVKERLKFWHELNDYAVSQRGASAKREFRITEIN